MRWIGAEELRTAFDIHALIDALETGHRGAKPEVADALIGPDKMQYLIRSAHNGAELIGSKLITIAPGNLERAGLPSVQAVIILFDNVTGLPKAALEATELTYWKTAADSALGSRLLSRKDAVTLLVVGAGGLAPWLVRGHMAAQPGIERVLVWNRTPERADALVEKLRAQGVVAEGVTNLQEAAGRADIISTATMSREPILRGEWLKAGTHVDLVGGFSRETREGDDALVTRGRLFVDCIESALDGVGDIVAPLQAGVITEDSILGDLFDLVPGKVAGRRSEEEITVFKNAGGAHLDLMVAAALLERLDPA